MIAIRRHVARGARQQSCGCAARLGQANGAQDIRRCAACSYAQQSVIGSQIQGFQLILGAHGLILAALAALAQRRVATGNQANDLARVATERGRTFAGVQHAQATAGAGANINKSAAVAHFGDQPLHKRAKFASRLRNNSGNVFMVMRKLFNQLRGRARI